MSKAEKKNPYPCAERQRNSAKWRLAGARANLEDIFERHGNVLHVTERAALLSAKDSLSKALETWEQW